MPALQVKECPDELYEQLRECAAEECRSMSQQTIYILKEYLSAYSQAREGRKGSFRASNFIYVDPTRDLVETAQERESRQREEAEREARREKRKRLIESIRSQPKFEVPEGFPSAAELIREDRDGRPGFEGLDMGATA